MIAVKVLFISKNSGENPEPLKLFMKLLLEPDDY